VTWNALFRSRLAGAWQEALELGVIPGPLWKYDLNSAYAWAILRGLPDPSTYRVTRDVSRDGVFVANGTVGVERPPFPFKGGPFRAAMLTSEEISGLKISVSRCLWGVTWRNVLDTSPQVERVRELFPRSWKKILRTFWGSWAARKGPETCLFDDGRILKSWTLPNVNANFIWAALVVSRVRMRLWREIQGRGPVHVFVDAAILRKELPTGDGIGDFKLVEKYPEGLTVHGTGIYSDRSCGRMISSCGTGKAEVLHYGQRNHAENARREEARARRENRIALERRERELDAAAGAVSRPGDYEIR